MVKFKVDNLELHRIKIIVNRAMRLIKYEEVKPERLELEMSLCACIAQGCKLKLKELAEANDFDFAHDVFGIHRNISRETGKLENHFRPRYAQKQN